MKLSSDGRTSFRPYFRVGINRSTSCPDTGEQTENSYWEKPEADGRDN